MAIRRVVGQRRCSRPAASTFLNRLAGDRAVVIELAPRVECDLVALSFIAQAIERRGVPVSMRGLSGHDMRILRYLGLSFPSPPDSHRLD
jgi:hypothetical protein